MQSVRRLRKRQSIPRAGMIRVADGEDIWGVSIQRTIEQGPYSPAELKKLAALSAQLCSATALAKALGFARAEAALDAFEVSGTAVAMLDRHTNVLRLNQAAERMLGPDLRVANRRLVSANPKATKALDRALHATIWSPEPPVLLPPIILPRRQGRPVLAYPSRPVGITRDAFSICQIIVVLIDLDAPPRGIESELRQVYKLTPAEARLASRLLSGEALDTVADALRISYETARNTLKSVLRKTDTHRQGELMSLLGRMAFRMRGKGEE